MPAAARAVHCKETLMYRSILIPTDGTEITAKAVSTAVELARALGARLSTITVKEPFPYSAISEMQPIPPQEFYDAQERIALKRVKEVVDAATGAGLACEAFTVEAQHPWEAILDHAKAQECDLIVMASHGRRGVGALLIGSETSRVLTHCNLPVLVVR
jgi:nucleotide-binding universal stress UspA family protein